jgi:hypothetical protein
MKVFARLKKRKNLIKMRIARTVTNLNKFKKPLVMAYK